MTNSTRRQAGAHTRTSAVEGATSSTPPDRRRFNGETGMNDPYGVALNAQFRRDDEARLTRRPLVLHTPALAPSQPGDLGRQRRGLDRFPEIAMDVRNQSAETRIAPPERGQRKHRNPSAPIGIER